MTNKSSILLYLLASTASLVTASISEPLSFQRTVCERYKPFSDNDVTSATKFLFFDPLPNEIYKCH